MQKLWAVAGVVSLTLAALSPATADSPPGFLLKWGSFGTGDGQFDRPKGIAVDPANDVYVGDYWNCRIEKFDENGTFITQWGTWDTSDGNFDSIADVACDPAGYVYVLDSYLDRVQKFDGDGTFLTKWGSGGSGDSQFNFPRGLGCDADGNVYVADHNNHRIQKFTSTGVLVTKWGSSGSGDGQFSSPFDVTSSPDGHIYVTDHYNHRVQKFTNTGVFVAKWGSEGAGNGQFWYPNIVSCDSLGNVYVSDVHERIQKFDGNGTYLTKWGSTGSADGQFEAISGITNGAGDIVYVLDYVLHRVQKFGTPPNTPIGIDVVVTPTDPGSGTAPVTLTFDEVTEEGLTTLAIEASGNVPPPTFRHGDPPTYYELTTTATHTGSVEVCIDFSTISYAQPDEVRLFHWEEGEWVDRTVSLDPGSSTLCASVTALSTFAIFEPVYGADGAVQITTHPAGDLGPDWSPDGSLIAFASDRGGSSDIWTVPVAGGTAAQITTGGASNPAWSPDGSLIAFDSDRSGSSEIWVIPATGEAATRITTGGSSYGPTWSPDGTQIAFFSEGGVGENGIWVIPAEGGAATHLTYYGGDRWPHWSPPGSEIAFQAGRDAHYYHIWAIPTAGGTATPITWITWGSGHDLQPAWSPDGSALAFVSERWGSYPIFERSIATASAGGGTVTRVTTDAVMDQKPCWSPDGTLIAFESETRSGNWDIYVIPSGLVMDNTPVGTDVVVTPTDPGTGTSPVTLAFDEVTGAGDTELTIGASGFAPPTGFRLGIPPTYYDLSTTATFTGSVEVCIDFSTISFGRRNKVRLYHWEDNRWVNRTVSVDPDANIVCASVTSLSPFAVFELVDYVQAEPVGDCLSVENTCETVPVVFERDDATPARAVSVTFELSSELELCDAPGVSITQGSWLGSYDTAFEVVDEGGGIYTVDQAILGLPCGEVPGGALFEIDVQSTGTDGVGTITVTEVLVRDCANAPLPGDPGAVASITIDTAPPTAVADVATLQKKSGNGSDGTTEITVSFTAPGDADETLVYRKGYGDYPEYDDGTGAVPTVPVTPAAAVTDGWTLTPVTVTGEGDEPTNRDYWYYVIFTEDACDNVSAVSNMTSGTLNYHLGDVTPGGGDNEVDILDLTALGADYGKTLIHGDPVNDLDVGPTADYSVDALPDTDNEIQFEDLMMFAINHGDVTRSVPVVAELDRPELVLTSERHGDLLKTRLMLRNHTASVKGIRVEVGFDRSQLELVRHASGELLQTSTAFVETLDAEGGCFVDLAVFGSGRVLEGSGEVAELTFLVRERGSRPHVVSVDFRGPNNERMGDFLAHGENPALTVTIPQPVRLELLGARPNPFTNATEIVFTLPDSRQVTMNIFDVSGRLVRTITDATLPAGRHAAAWDGRDASGQATGAGIYFYTFQAGEHRETRKLLHVR